MQKLVVLSLFVLLFMGTLKPVNALGGLIVVGPSDPWCNAINNASPGDEIVLASGNYPTTCVIGISGTASAPITIHSESETNRATFTYPGSTANILEVSGSSLILRGFEFRPASEAVDSIRILGGTTNITVERNLFKGIGNIAVSANSGITSNLVIRNNTFLNLVNTPVYIGCHESQCWSTNLLFESNFIDGVRPTDTFSIGYGIEVKLNSWATIRDNTIYRTKGPPIMVYGSNRGDPPSIIEGNYAEASQNEGGIVIGGGPAIVRNNILVGNGFGGVSAQNYASRNLQQNIWIVHNTILNNADSGINVQGWTAGSGNIIAYNAILPLTGTPALSPSAPAGLIIGNVTCTSASTCFVNGTTPPFDLWPALGGSLFDMAGSGTEPWRPKDDFMGVPRNSATDVGAFERTLLTNDRLVGGGKPRPPRISTDKTPPSVPMNLKLQ